MKTIKNNKNNIIYPTISDYEEKMSHFFKFIYRSRLVKIVKPRYYNILKSNNDDDFPQYISNENSSQSYTISWRWNWWNPLTYLFMPLFILYNILISLVYIIVVAVIKLVESIYNICVLIWKILFHDMTISINKWQFDHKNEYN